MKKTIAISASFLIIIGVVLPSVLFAAGGGVESACPKPRMVLLTPTPDTPNGFPSKAKVELKYCEEYNESPILDIKASGLPAESSYYITLNGKVSKIDKSSLPGNDLIRKSLQYSGTTDIGEHYANIGPEYLNDEGKLISIMKPKLVPGDYSIKVFLKQADQPYKCVLGQDNVIFTIKTPVATIAKPIEITAPSTDEIKGHIHIVKGKLTDPSLKVHIYICPMTATDCWLQNKPTGVDRDGYWQSLCYFGEEKEGTNEYFEVYAFKGETEYESGHTFAKGKNFQNYMKKNPVYAKETYHRIK